MFSEILPWRFRSLTNFLNENTNFVFRSVLATPPIECNPEAAVEYISLICHRDVNIYILATKSFLRFFGDVAVVVHSDGTLTEKDIEVLQHHIPGLRVISRREADDRVSAEVGSSLLKDARRNDVSFIKLIDVNLFSRKRRIVADSDILFLRRPAEVIDWIERGDAKGFYHIVRGGNTRFGRHLEALNIELETNIESLDYCSGFIGYDGQIGLADIEKVARVLTAVAEGWGLEQVAYAFLLADGSRKLSQEKYFAMLQESSEEDIGRATMVHFGGKLKHSQYLRWGKRVTAELAGGDSRHLR